MTVSDPDSETVPQWLAFFEKELEETMTNRLKKIEARFKEEMTRILQVQSSQSTMTQIILDNLINNDCASVSSEPSLDDQVRECMIQRLDSMEVKLQKGMRAILQLQSSQSITTRIVLEKVIENCMADSVVPRNDFPMQAINYRPDQVETSSEEKPLIIQEVSVFPTLWEEEDDLEIYEALEISNKNLPANINDEYSELFPKIQVKRSLISMSLKERSACESSTDEMKSESDDEEDVERVGHDGGSYCNDSEHDDYGYDEDVYYEDQETVGKIRILLRNISLGNWWTTKKKLLKLSISTPLASTELVDIFHRKLKKSEGRLHTHLVGITDEFTKKHDGIRGLNERIFWNRIENMKWPLSAEELMQLTEFVITNLPNEFKYHVMMNLINNAQTESTFFVLKFLMKRVPDSRCVRYLRRDLHLAFYMKN